jgi:hypothetical protein
MAEYNNPLSGFLGGFSAPLIAREKEDRLLKNQLGLIGLQNDLATQTATATREFETINQTILSYSNRRDKLTEERNKMIRSAYAPPGSNNLMPLSPAQSNARIREMGFEPGYFKQIVQQMDDQISKLGEGIDQMMIYKTNKYGPSGVTFKHISSIGRLPPPGGAGAGLTGPEVNPLAGAGAPPPTDTSLLGSVGKGALDAASATGSFVSDVWDAGTQGFADWNIDARKEGYKGLEINGVTIVPPVVDKAVTKTWNYLSDKDNHINKFYENVARALGIEPSEVADFWMKDGSNLAKVLDAAGNLDIGAHNLITKVDNVLISLGFVPPGYEKDTRGNIVLIEGGLRDLMFKEAAREAGVPIKSKTLGVGGQVVDDEVLPSFDAGNPPPRVDLSSVPIYEPTPGIDQDENIIAPRTEGTIPIYDPLRTDPYNDEPIYDIPSATTALEQTNRQNEYMRQQIAALERKRAEQMIQVADRDASNRALAAQVAEQDAANAGPYRNTEGLSRVELNQIIQDRYPHTTFDTFSGIETAGDAAAQYKAAQDQSRIDQDQEAIMAEQQDAATVTAEVTAEEEANNPWFELKRWYENLKDTDVVSPSVKGGASGGAAIILGEALRRNSDTYLKGKFGGATISGGSTSKALKAARKAVKSNTADLKAAKKLLKRMEKNPEKFGDAGEQATQKARVDKLQNKVTGRKRAFNNLMRDKVFKVGGKVSIALGALTVAATTAIETAFGADVAEDVVYRMIEGNEEAIGYATKFLEVGGAVVTPALTAFIETATAAWQNPRPSSSRERMSGPEMQFAPGLQGDKRYNYEPGSNMNAYDATVPRSPRASLSRGGDPFIDVGQGDYYGRDADRESFGMRGWYDQQAREQKRTQAPRTSIRKRSDVESTDESAGTFDDLINWVTSLGSSVVPEAAANADVPIESIGLAREVPEMVLNNPRVGIGPKISATESNGLYDAVGYNTVTDEARPPDPMVNTSKWADVRAKYGDTLGIGKYQFTNDFLVDIYADTLNKSKKDAQIFLDNQVFKESVQEQALALAFGYLGLEDVIRGKMSAKRFVDKIEGRWHGIAKAIEEDPNYKQVMIDDLEGMVEQATGRTFTLSNRE